MSAAPLSALEARSRFYDLVSAAEAGQESVLYAPSGAAVRLTAVTDPAAVTGYPGRTLKWARSGLEEMTEAAAAGQPQLLLRSGSVPVAVLLPVTPAAPVAGTAPSPAPGPAAAAAPAPAATAPAVGEVSGGASGGGVRTTATAGETFADLAAAPEPVRFGLEDLDALTGGLAPGTVTLLAAEAGAGGSLLATAPAREAALRAGRAVLYAATGGLTRAAVATRMVAAETGADHQGLRQTLAAGNGPEEVRAAMAALTEAPLHLLDGPLTAEHLTAAAAGIEDLALIVVDRLQHRVDPASPLSGRDALRAAVRHLAEFARARQVAVLAVLDTLRLEVTAAVNPDARLALTRDDHDDQRAAVEVAERDSGVLGTVPLTADLRAARFLPAPTPGADGDVAESEDPGNAAGDGAGPKTKPRAASGAGERQWPPPGFKAAASSERVAKAPLHEAVITAVREELEKAGGDSEAALKALKKRSIREVNALQDRFRQRGRLGYAMKPPMPDIFDRPSPKQPDQIWEARHKWQNPAYSKRGKDLDLTVEVLDLNAAYLNALKCPLPKWALEHSGPAPEGSGLVHDRKRSGVHLITPPEWRHSHLPNPLGNREEPGPIWVTEPTLRLLLELSGSPDPDKRLCDPPVIHESWTADASEELLGKVRENLNDARLQAAAAGDELTAAYVRDMYNKLVSTLIPSPANDFMDRPDWAHLIRSQANAALWRRARKAHENGLTVIRVARTDELHVIGDWRAVWREGRELPAMKAKTDEETGEPLRYGVREVTR